MVESTSSRLTHRLTVLRRLDRYRAALQHIVQITDKTYGGDWDEIEEARSIARDVLREEE